MEKYDYRISISRQLLAKSLVNLLKTKELGDITISKICIEAGVSRTTFYNNHKRKEDILSGYLSDWYYMTFKDILYNNIGADPIFTFFDSCYSQLDFFRTVIKCKLDYLILRELMNCAEFFINESKSNPSLSFQINKDFLKDFPYSFYATIGKTYMAIVFWVENDSITLKEITNLFVNADLQIFADKKM